MSKKTKEYVYRSGWIMDQLESVSFGMAFAVCYSILFNKKLEKVVPYKE
jgi:hypothetical protein